MTLSSSNSSEQRFGFWARLPLIQKMFIAFGALFVFALIIAAVSLYGLNQVQAQYEQTLSQGVEVRRLATLIDVDLLRARRAEKNFQLRWRIEGFDTAYANYVTSFRENIAAMRGHVDEIAPFAPVADTLSGVGYSRQQYETDIANLRQYIDIYEKGFLDQVEAYRQKGYDENTGFEGEFRTYAAAIEKAIAGREGLETLELTYLRIRRAEKDYLARGDQAYADDVARLVAQLKLQVTESEGLNTSQKLALRDQLDKYLQAFNGLVELNKQIADLDENLTQAAGSVEPLAIKLLDIGQRLGAESTAQAQALANQILTIVVAIVVVVLGLSVLLAFAVSRQLTAPILSLTATAQEISSGNFDIKAQVQSADEIGALANAFNVMTDRLGKAFEDVRRRALAVQTSAEVSRRLSVATNIRQLAVDVVEQVQAAFNYYHAHIYFFDDARENLVMAGGTGDAGATMLARGHKIPRGRGLVGRAAESNQPILVEDTSKDPDWLPNPLLPDTKSEVAIPIAAGDVVLGVLDVQQNITNGLDAEDVELLQSLAGQIAISYQNARAFEQSKTQAELETLVNTIGQKIQRAGSVDDTLQIAIRELGNVLGASRVRVNVQTARDTVSNEN